MGTTPLLTSPVIISVGGVIVSCVDFSQWPPHWVLCFQTCHLQYSLRTASRAILQASARCCQPGPSTTQCDAIYLIQSDTPGPSRCLDAPPSHTGYFPLTHSASSHWLYWLSPLVVTKTLLPQDICTHCSFSLTQCPSQTFTGLTHSLHSDASSNEVFLVYPTLSSTLSSQSPYPALFSFPHFSPPAVPRSLSHS